MCYWLGQLSLFVRGNGGSLCGEYFMSLIIMRLYTNYSASENTTQIDQALRFAQYIYAISQLVTVKSNAINDFLI